MKSLLELISVLVVLGILGLVLNNLWTRRYDFLSWRNLFLLGFALFYGVGSYFTVTLGVASDLYVPSEAGFSLLLVGVLLFLVLFGAGCALGGRLGWVGRLVPKLELPVTLAGVVACIVALMAAGVLASLLEMTSYLSALGTQFKPGLVTAGMALATYLVLARPFNPAAWAVFLPTLAVAGLVCTVGDSGRRALLGVMMAVAWMWYFYSLRYQTMRKSIVRLGGMGVVTALMLATFATVRQESGAERAVEGFRIGTRIQQFARLIRNPTIQRGAYESMVFSDTPTNTMFIMENYPRSYEYLPFHGAVYFIGNPVPRMIWPSKPMGLGIQVQQHLGSPANLGVGIIGHGWAEGAWLGIAGYALFFGILLTAADRLTRERAWNPYFLAAMGSSLGNIFALTRGETSLFLVLAFTSFVGVAVVMCLVKWTLGPIAGASAPLLVWAAHEAGYGLPGAVFMDPGEEEEWSTSEDEAWQYGEPLVGAAHEQGRDEPHSADNGRAPQTSRLAGPPPSPPGAGE